jgi:hypothetical protein
MHLLSIPGVKGQSQVTDILNMCVSLNTCVSLMFMEVIFIIQSLKHKQEYIFSIFKTKWNLFNYALLKYIQHEYIFPKHS